MNCEHEQEMLMGVADGIICRKCGKKFSSFTEILAARGEKPAEEAPEEPAGSAPAEQKEAPKRRTRTRAKA